MIALLVSGPALSAKVTYRAVFDQYVGVWQGHMTMHYKNGVRKRLTVKQNFTWVNLPGGGEELRGAAIYSDGNKVSVARIRIYVDNEVPFMEVKYDGHEKAAVYIGSVKASNGSINWIPNDTVAAKKRQDVVTFERNRSGLIIMRQKSYFDREYNKGNVSQYYQGSTEMRLTKVQ